MIISLSLECLRKIMFAELWATEQGTGLSLFHGSGGMKQVLFPRSMDFLLLNNVCCIWSGSEGFRSICDDAQQKVAKQQCPALRVSSANESFSLMLFFYLLFHELHISCWGGSMPLEVIWASSIIQQRSDLQNSTATVSCPSRPRHKLPTLVAKSVFLYKINGFNTPRQQQSQANYICLQTDQCN